MSSDKISSKQSKVTWVQLVNTPNPASTRATAMAASVLPCQAMTQLASEIMAAPEH